MPVFFVSSLTNSTALCAASVKIALELMRRSTAAESAGPIRDRALSVTQVWRNQKSPVICAIAQFMTPSITEKATGKVAF